MDDSEVAKYWDDNAPAWIDGVRAGYDAYRDYGTNPAFFGILPGLKDKRVLDVGCGEGFNTRKLAELGAEIVGIDISEAMIEAARQCDRNQPQCIKYHVASGSEMSMFTDESFDAVVSTMAMMDMPNYISCIREIARVLKHNGLFQFSILHPCTMTPVWEWVKNAEGYLKGLVVGNYFGLEETRPDQDVEQWYFSAAPPEVKARTRQFRIPRFFRTLSEYVNTLIESGFRIEKIIEPYADQEAVEKYPHLVETRIVPYSLVLQCYKE
jgi:ubiquinone/menaquinone biosynthesis C-methylase UbiE